MFVQFYFNHNSNSEDILHLKNFCSNINLNLESLNSHNLTKKHTFRKIIHTHRLNIPNILIIWSTLENQEAFQLVHNFCITNLIQLTYLYTLNRGFYEFLQPKIHKPIKPVSMFSKTQIYPLLELQQSLFIKAMYNSTCKQKNIGQKDPTFLEL